MILELEELDFDDEAISYQKLDKFLDDISHTI